MLLSFSVENWMSFREKATLSMIATSERQHGERLAGIKKYGARVLPVAAIYGGNASGKTNFFKALNFAKRQVVKGRQPDDYIPIEAFRLDKSNEAKRTEFSFELLIDGDIYNFSFAVTRKAVVEEKLVRLFSTSEKEIYHRVGEEPECPESLRTNDTLKYAWQGTQKNQLFLTNTVTQKITEFKKIFDWFKDSLVLIAPDSRFEPFERFFGEEHPLYSRMNEILLRLDTGIEHLKGEEISFENLQIPEALKTKLQDELKEGRIIRLFSLPLVNDRIIVSRRDGKLLAKKLFSYHQDTDGKEVRFEMRQESDGTLRIIDLLPAFLDLSSAKQNKVYVIDELDRSLHTLLIRQLLESYLAGCTAESRSQLLFTTHNVLLMDQKLLRRDEMWVTERDADGATTLYSFSDYADIRKDKDIRKSYLQGRLGGVPRILLCGSFADMAREHSGDDEDD